MFRALTVVEEDAVVARITQISERYSRVEDLYDALKWRLARDPESGIRISANAPYYLVKTDTAAYFIDGVPVIRALYSVSENEVVILAVDLADSPAGDVD